MNASRLLAIGSAVVLVTTLAACTTSAPTRLRVDVSGLPPGVHAQVEVDGPTRYSVTTTDERDVPAGSYVVRVNAARLPAGTSYASDETVTIEVDAGTTATAPAAYRITIPDSTKVLDPDRPGITGTVGTTVSFAADAPVAASLAPGQVFIVGEGPQTPTVLIRRVVSVSRTASGVVVDTTAARLDEALPSGVIRFEENAEPITAQPATVNMATDRPAARTAFLDKKPILAFDTGQASFSKKGKKCGGSSAYLSYELNSFSLKPHGDFGWGLLPPEVHLSLGLDVAMEETVAANVRQAVDCVWEPREREIGALSKICSKLVGKIVRVGPISLGCEVSALGGFNAEVSGEFTIELKTTTNLGFKAGYDTGGKGDGKERRKPKVDPELFIPLLDPASNPKFSASIGGHGGLKFGLKGGDPLDIATLELFVEATIGGTLSVNTAGDIKAAIPVTVTLGAEMGLDAKLKDWEEGVHLLTWTHNIWEWSSKTGKNEDKVHRTPLPPKSTPKPVSICDTATPEALNKAYPLPDEFEYNSIRCYDQYVLAAAQPKPGYDLDGGAEIFRFQEGSWRHITSAGHGAVSCSGIPPNVWAKWGLTCEPNSTSAPTTGRPATSGEEQYKYACEQGELPKSDCDAFFEEARRQGVIFNS